MSDLGESAFLAGEFLKESGWSGSLHYWKRTWWLREPHGYAPASVKLANALVQFLSRERDRKQVIEGFKHELSEAAGTPKRLRLRKYVRAGVTMELRRICAVEEGQIPPGLAEDVAALRRMCRWARSPRRPRRGRPRSGGYR